MRIIDRYVAKSVLIATAVVMFVVLSLDIVFGFIAETEDLKNNYGVVDAAIYIAMTLPRRVYDYLPLGAFMGCLIGLGALAKNSELTVVRAAGVSLGRIVWASMKPVILVVILGGLLGEYVAPTTEKIAQSAKALKQGAQSNIVYSQGLWHKEGENFIHVNAVEPNGALHGISINYYGEQRRLEKSLFAARALFHEGGWSLIDVQITEFEESRVFSSTEELMPWHTELTPALLSILIVKPDNLSMSGLFKYAAYLSEQGLDGGVYVLSFWKKALQPITTISLVLIAISFVFGPLRSVAMGTRVFVGLVVGLSFKYMQDLLGPASMVFGFEPIIASLAPIAVCFLLGIVMLRRAA
ncbi:LPS export ABC transporter permease LptG [Oleiphilus sp. HI0079]|uniref:LPS export ABC transporter permease LptG n=1 Tax=Oleiphilus sp. HI0079 TaxID=1822254 RepID=UPI0009EE0446|nr:LPS export ABC transporter permease LptG [Oleiphilus sp. HI0079]